MSKSTQFLVTQKIVNLENYLPGQKPDPILCVKTSDSVQEVLKALLEHSLHAAPVIDPQQPQTLNGTPFVAVVSVVDLLTAFAFQPVFTEFNTDMKLSELKEETLKKVLEAQQAVLRSSTSEFLGLSLEGKRLWVFSEKDTLDKLFDAFCVGVHRVLVAHNLLSTPYWTFITQMDVLRYLKNQSFQCDSMFHDIFLQPISSFSLGTMKDKDKVFALTFEHSAIRGFRFMLQQNELSALPIIDKSGNLIDTLSASDFRGVNLENLKDTLLPVCDFLKKARGKMEYDLVTGTADEPLYSIVDKVMVHGHHRVWIVEGKKLIGVVSLTDIIKTFSDYAPKSFVDYTSKLEMQMKSVPMSDQVEPKVRSKVN
jgi:CBS domain-containing protein